MSCPFAWQSLMTALPAASADGAGSAVGTHRGGGADHGEQASGEGHGAAKLRAIGCGTASSSPTGAGAEQPRRAADDRLRGRAPGLAEQEPVDLVAVHGARADHAHPAMPARQRVAGRADDVELADRHRPGGQRRRPRAGPRDTRQVDRQRAGRELPVVGDDRPGSRRMAERRRDATPILALKRGIGLDLELRPQERRGQHDGQCRSARPCPRRRAGGADARAPAEARPASAPAPGSRRGRSGPGRAARAGRRRPAPRPRPLRAAACFRRRRAAARSPRPPAGPRRAGRSGRRSSGRACSGRRSPVPAAGAATAVDR